MGLLDTGEALRGHRSPVFELLSNLIILFDELVYLVLDHFVLLVYHFDVILESIRLGKEVKIVIVPLKVYLALLSDLSFESVD